MLKRVFNGFYGSGWLVLFATMLMWSANVLAGRLAVGQISPMALVCMRWALSAVLMYSLQCDDIFKELPVLKAHWLLIFLGGVLGFTGFNALFYMGAHYTTGVNISIVQGAVPIFTMMGAFLVFGTRFTPLQIIGLVMTIVGVLLVGAQGDFSTLAGFQFNLGDIFILLACMFYAAYTLALRNRPKIKGLTLFAAMAGLAFLTSIPLFIWEILAGKFFWPTPLGWIIMLYVAIFPSLVSQILFIRGVELVGPSRASLFVNLLPVMGTIMSVVFLGEGFHLYHAVALVLVLGGIYVAERLGIPTPAGGRR